MTTKKFAATARTARTLHLCDIENLCGGSTPNDVRVCEVASEYRTAASQGVDLYVVACSPARAAACTFGWGTQAQWLFKGGVNGADQALLDAYSVTEIAARFDRVVIASGDGIFADFAAALGQLGVHVTVVARDGTLSALLRMASASVIMLPKYEGGSDNHAYAA